LEDFLGSFTFGTSELCIASQNSLGVEYCDGVLQLASLLSSIYDVQVFVEYTDTAGAAKAKSSLHGRKFSGNSVIAVYYPEDKFERGEYGG
jgi:hypothetical protein